LAPSPWPPSSSPFPSTPGRRLPIKGAVGAAESAILLVSFTAVAFIRTIAPPLLRRRSYRRRQDPSQGPARPSHQRIFKAALATKLSAPRNRLESPEPRYSGQPTWIGLWHFSDLSACPLLHRHQGRSRHQLESCPVTVWEVRAPDAARALSRTPRCARGNAAAVA
jgi:hypothetical protein